jgi:hypothetical protein
VTGGQYTSLSPYLVESHRWYNGEHLRKGLYQIGSILVRAFVNQVIEVIEQKSKSEEKDR